MEHTTLLEREPAGAAVAKLITCWSQGGGDPAEMLELAGRFPRSPQVRSAAQYLQKGAVAGGDVGAWATNSGIAADFWALLGTRSVAVRILQRARRVPFRTPWPRWTTGAGAAWMGEGLARPASSAQTDVISLEPTAIGSIAVISHQVLRFGPVAEAAIRRMLVDGLAQFLDSQLLDASITASASRPASITHSAAVHVSTGGSAAQILADLASLIDKVGSPLDGAVWAMRTSSLLRVRAALAAVGYVEPGGTLLGLPVIAGSGSPQQIALVDCDAIATAFDDVVLDLSRQASLEMQDTSSQSGISGTGASLVSMYQIQGAAIKAEFPVNYLSYFLDGSSPQQTGVSYMLVTY